MKINISPPFSIKLKLKKKMERNKLIKDTTKPYTITHRNHRRSNTYYYDNIMQTEGVNLSCQLSLVPKMLVCGEYFGSISIITIIPLNILQKSRLSQNLIFFQWFMRQSMFTYYNEQDL